MSNNSNSWFSGNSIFGDYPTVPATSSQQSSFIALLGDTMRVMTTRTITSENDDGYAGEICVGPDDGVFYLYFCVADNVWRRLPIPSTW